MRKELAYSTKQAGGGPAGSAEPYAIEIKTGTDWRLTPSQQHVCNMLPIGGHVTADKADLDRPCLWDGGRRFAFPPYTAYQRLAGAPRRDYLTAVLPCGAMSDTITTTVSTKGQVILPKAIREKRKWGAGTRLVVEETPEGVLLKPASPFKPTRPEDVYGMLRYKGKPKTIEEMDAGIEALMRREHARGRY